MHIALLSIDGDSILSGLKIAFYVSVGFGLFMGLLMPIRLHGVWKRNRPVLIPMVCDDAQVVRFKLIEAMKRFGYKAPAQSEGAITLRAGSFRRAAGVSDVTLSFPEPRKAVVRGPAAFVAGYAKANNLQMSFAPDAPLFGKWLVQTMLSRFVWVVGFLFVAIFAITLIIPH